MGSATIVLGGRDGSGAGSGAALEVPRLGFGAMRITGAGVWGPPADRSAAIAVLRRSVELGCTFIDTADAYGPDVSEELIAEALHPYAEEVVIATKGGLTRSGPGRWHSDASPSHLREACDGSLRRLRLDRIQLYQLHRPDPHVPFAESLGTLVELQQQGKIAHIGLSNVSLAQLREAQALTSIVSVQNRFNVADHSAVDVLDACSAEGIAFLPWAPIQDADGSAPVARAAERLGADRRQVVLAWLLARSPVMLPIPGTGSVAHLEQNAAARDLELTAGELTAISGE
jgi:pyridoxine 4-dehydrogenase